MIDVDNLTRRLADPAFFVTPEFSELLGHLRDHEPVRWCQAWPQRGFWAVTRHADCMAVYNQPSLFSSEAAGNIIPADPELYLGDRPSMGYGLMMTNVDPPAHGHIRRIFSRTFGGPNIAKLDGLCQEVVDGILAEIANRDVIDFVVDVAAPLPARLICRLLGVPRQDWDFISRYANSFASFSDPELQLGPTFGDTFQIAMRETFNYIAALVAERRVAPRDDFATIAAQAEVDGVPASHEMAAWNCWSLLAAGFETSRNVISGGLHALITHPDQLRRLREDPRLMPAAIDEMVRWSSPATANLRVATAETMIAGQMIAQGDWVVLFLDSANRDGSVFADPYRFDITRRPNPYLSFGHGIHNCLGRMLALLEVRVMVRSLLARSETIELAGPSELIASTIAKGFKHLPLRIRWSPSAQARAA